MPPRLNLFTNRERANSFGGAAHSYDAHRPRYPDQLVDDLLTFGAQRVLDVGAGTGIASTQLTERGADVLAVEPDTRMASIAQEKGIPTEIATFEQWEPAGRRFDLVVFAASFHWVDPAAALPKVRDILSTGGKLALIWNRLIPTRPTRAEFASIYQDYMDVDTRAMDGGSDDLAAVLAAAGFTVKHQRYPHNLHYTAQQWVELVFTYSNHLTLATDKATELRSRLAERIDSAGVSVGGDALAILGTPS
jgi:trans-aconitate methyltransferase